MSEFSFRARLTTSPSKRFNEAAPELMLPTVERQAPPVTPKTFGEPTGISEARELLVVGGPYNSADTAGLVGARYKEALAVAFARLQLGVDAAGLFQTGQFFTSGLNLLAAGQDHRVLNDAQGLTVFDSAIPTKFARLGNAQMRHGISSPRFTRILTAILERDVRLSEREELALELYHASHFEELERSRFLTLMIAIEALLDPKERDSPALELVATFLKSVAEASELDALTKASLLGSLQFLRRDSISQTGRALSRERLGDRLYEGMRSDKFFTHCYEIRSDIVHRGHVRDKRSGLPTGELDRFVSDLLTFRFLDLDV